MSALKIRKGKQPHLFLTLLPSPSFWTAELAIGLGLAIAFHASAVFLFHIDSYLFPTVSPLRPSSVIAPLSGLSTTSNVDHQKWKSPFLAKLPQPEAPKIYEPLPLVDFELQRTAPSEPVVYDALIAENLSPPKQILFRLSHGFRFMNAPSLQIPSLPFRAVWEFRASLQSGQIIWTRLIRSSGQVRFDKQLEEALKKARLNLAKGIGFTQGIVEVEAL